MKFEIVPEEPIVVKHELKLILNKHEAEWLRQELYLHCYSNCNQYRDFMNTLEKFLNIGEK